MSWQDVFFLERGHTITPDNLLIKTVPHAGLQTFLHLSRSLLPPHMASVNIVLTTAVGYPALDIAHLLYIIS